MAVDSIYLHGRLSSIDTSKYRCNFETFPQKLEGVDAEYVPVSPQEFLQSSFERSIWRLKVDSTHLDIAQWETPKRTRTYPLAKCYRQLGSPFKKVALIPIIKDEGSGVNPDVLGIETIYLLDAYGYFVVTTRYIDARADERASSRTKEKIKVLRDQAPDFEHAFGKLRIVAANEVTPRAWNRGEVLHFGDSLEKATDAYQRIQEKTGVRCSTIASCRARIARIRQDGLESYWGDVDASKRRSQHSETSGIQPKEHLALAAEKVRVDIELHNDLGVNSPIQIHLVPDEGWRFGDTRVALEKKANPTSSDLMDALFKALAFRSARITNQAGQVHFGIGATYKHRTGACWSQCPEFQTCSKSQFGGCRWEPLQSLKEASTIGQTEAARNLLQDGHAHNFLTFVLGVQEMNAVIETAAQKTIIEAFLSHSIEEPNGPAAR